MVRRTGSEYSTVEEFFWFEIFIIKLCGGLMIKGKSLIAVIYRSFIIFAARYVFSRYVLNIKALKRNDPNALWDNVSIFWAILVYLALGSLFISLYTGHKYSNLLNIILKKKFHRSLVGGLSASASHQSQAPVRNLLPRISYDKHYVDGADARPYNPMHQNRPIEDDIAQPQSSRISLLRMQIVFVVVLAASIATLREEMIFNTRHLIQTNTNLSTSRPLTYVEPLQVYQNSTTSVKNSTAGSGVILISTQAHIPRLINAIHLGDIQGTIKYFLLLSSRFIVKIIQTSMNTFQVYGPTFTMLMISATFSDMITALRMRLKVEAHTNRFRQSSIDLLGEDKRAHSMHSKNVHRYETQRAVELLTQIRDSLLAMREIFSLENVLLLLQELVRLMLILSFFTAFVMKTYAEWMITIVGEFVRVNSSMIILRLGYYWLHTNAYGLRRDIIEQELLTPDSDSSRHLTSIRTARYQLGSKQFGLRDDVRSIVKLTTEIGEIWPTHWYVPDLKSIIYQNLLVITLVATSEQLVTAGKINRQNK